MEVRLELFEGYLITRGAPNLVQIYELIDEKTKKRLKTKTPASDYCPAKRNSESMSSRDIEGPMGTHRDKCHKVNGKLNNDHSQ